MQSDTVITRAAQWAHELGPEDIPERVMGKARLQILSVLGAMHASARHEAGDIILSAVDRWARPGPCTIVPWGRRVDLLSAVFANAATSLALDYDDYLLFGHTGHSAVCVSLAVAEHEQRSWRDVLVAQVIANEIEGRLGASVVLGPHNGQGWSHIHVAGAALATAKLLGLSADAMAHAVAIALYQPPFLLWPGFMGPDSKVVTAATPSVIGVQAAMLAASGATGALDIVERPQGFWQHFSYEPLPAWLTGFGRAWTTDTLAYKIYPGCAYVDTTVDAVLGLRGDLLASHGQDFDLARVDHITVDASMVTVEMDRLSREGGAFDPKSPISLNFSIPGNVALALLDGRLGPTQLRRDSLAQRADAIESIARRVTLRHDAALTLDMLRVMHDTLDLSTLLSTVRWRDLARAMHRWHRGVGGSLGLSIRDVVALRQHARGLPGWACDRMRDAAARPGTWDLGDHALEGFSMPFAARVTVRLRDGSVWSREQRVPLGGPGRPWAETRGLVIDKLVRESGARVGEDVARRTAMLLAGAGDERAVSDTLATLCG